MIGNRIHHRLRHLRAACIVEKDKIASLLDGREHGADLVDREIVMAGELRCGRGGAHGDLALYVGIETSILII
ncbi:hypothetical protein RHSP_24583 [Rhizobium freirei PRF 81]|uniref:Uncharacterized protein n=1 Tax=Rhizobium freirei PRF 81 TaxID=363754 RepID=N6UZZ6_9HYPH|nr:hypothetical protein RHSP_24583 [Rhizobium freirei PRF 81]